MNGQICRSAWWNPALRSDKLKAVSYDLHIIRTDDWPNAAENPISFEEWIDHAHANDNLVEAGMLSLHNTNSG